MTTAGLAVRSITLLLIVLLAVLPYLPPRAAGMFVLVSLGALPLWLFGLLLTLWLRRKHRKWSLCLAFALISCLPFLTQELPVRLTRLSSAASADTLCIISWNADNLQLSQETLEASSDKIKQQQPDIICFQERPHTVLLAWDSIQAAFPEHPHRIINSREDEVLNLAILSRWPISGVKEFYFPDSYNKILQADIHRNHQTIRLFNVHLQTTGAGPSGTSRNVIQTLRHNASERNRQAVLLAEAIDESPYPVIVCGDFNDTPSSYAVRTIARRLQDGFVDAGCGWGGSYQPWGGWFRIDFTFCSKDFNVLRYELIENVWSDHKMQKCVVGMK